MEDKWFIFLEGDTLFFHRSWTGHCIFRLTLTREGEKYAVSDALVNRDAGQYGGADDVNDERLLTYLIDNLLLGGRTVPLSTRMVQKIVKRWADYIKSG